MKIAVRKVAVVVASTLLCSSLFGGQPYPGTRCLGPFCNDKGTTEPAVFKVLGRPAKKADVYCYRARRRFLQVGMAAGTVTPTIDSVLLSDFPTCMHMPAKLNQVTSADLSTWKTPEGIGLGSSEADVVRTFGKPSLIHRLDSTTNFGNIVLGRRPTDAVPKVGQRSIEYRLNDRTRSTEFGIRDGRVAWIALFR